MEITIEFRARYKQSVADNFETLLRRKVRDIFKVKPIEACVLTVVKTTVPGQKSWEIKVIPPHKAGLQGPLPRHSIVVEVAVETKLGFICIFTIPEEDPACITHMTETIGEESEVPNRAVEDTSVAQEETMELTRSDEAPGVIAESDAENLEQATPHDEILARHPAAFDEDEEDLTEKLLLSGMDIDEIERLKSTLAAVCVSKLPESETLEDFSIEPKELGVFVKEHYVLSGQKITDGRGVISSFMTRNFRHTRLATKVDSVWYFDAQTLTGFIGNDFGAIRDRATLRKDALKEIQMSPSFTCSNTATPTAVPGDQSDSIAHTLQVFAAWEAAHKELSAAEETEEEILETVQQLSEELERAKSSLLEAQQRTAALRATIAQQAPSQAGIDALREQLDRMSRLLKS